MIYRSGTVGIFGGSINLSFLSHLNKNYLRNLRYQIAMLRTNLKKKGQFPIYLSFLFRYAHSREHQENRQKLQEQFHAERGGKTQC